MSIILFSFTVSVIFILLVFNLVHKKKLKEQYSLLWLFFGFSMLVLSLNSKWLEIVAHILDIKYPPAFIFFIGIIICLILILHITVIVSKLSERVVRLTQEIGILKNQLETVEDIKKEIAVTKYSNKDVGGGY